MVVCGFPLNVGMSERTFAHCACVRFDRRMGAEDVNRQLRLMLPECVERAWLVKGWGWLMERENKEANENQGRAGLTWGSLLLRILDTNEKQHTNKEFDCYTSWPPTEHRLLYCPHPSCSWNKNIHPLLPHQTSGCFHLSLAVKSSTDAEMPDQALSNKANMLQ